MREGGEVREGGERGRGGWKRRKRDGEGRKEERKEESEEVCQVSANSVEAGRPSRMSSITVKLH